MHLLNLDFQGQKAMKEENITFPTNWKKIMIHMQANRRKNKEHPIFNLSVTPHTIHSRLIMEFYVKYETCAAGS